jgi:uncharacterized BrkB/YihY/UPF0761 family membrane protein
LHQAQVVGRHDHKTAMPGPVSASSLDLTPLGPAPPTRAMPPQWVQPTQSDAARAVVAQTGAPMKKLKWLIGKVDDWQRHNRFVGPAYAVIKKYGDDNASLLVVALGWYGFTAIYPLLLVVVTVFAYIGEKSLGSGVINELHQFPVIGAQFKPGHGGTSLHGSMVGLVIGLLGLLYGSLGVTQTAQQAMARVWNIPQLDRPGYLARLGRSVLGLIIIGVAFVVSASASSLATGSGTSWWLRVPVLLGLLILNTGFYLGAFRVLTPNSVTSRTLLPGAMLGSVTFTFLTTVGTGLIVHQLKHTTATYGALASVIGVVTYLLLLAKTSMYAAELSPVLDRHLWPRALPTRRPTEADDQVLHDLAHEERRREDERVGVGFGANSVREAQIDATSRNDDVRQPEFEGGTSPAGHQS